MNSKKLKPSFKTHAIQCANKKTFLVVANYYKLFYISALNDIHEEALEISK